VIDVSIAEGWIGRPVGFFCAFNLEQKSSASLGLVS
jgi:hypothetical protein